MKILSHHTLIPNARSEYDPPESVYTWPEHLSTYVIRLCLCSGAGAYSQQQAEYLKQGWIQRHTSTSALLDRRCKHASAFCQAPQCQSCKADIIMVSLAAHVRMKQKTSTLDICAERLHWGRMQALACPGAARAAQSFRKVTANSAMGDTSLIISFRYRVCFERQNIVDAGSSKCTAG